MYNKFGTFSKKKKTLIADLFPKLRTPKNVLKQISKKSHLKGHFSERYVERKEALWKSERHYLSIVIDHCDPSWIRKNLSY